MSVSQLAFEATLCSIAYAYCRGLGANYRLTVQNFVTLFNWFNLSNCTPKFLTAAIKQAFNLFVLQVWGLLFGVACSCSIPWWNKGRKGIVIVMRIAGEEKLLVKHLSYLQDEINY